MSTPGRRVEGPVRTVTFGDATIKEPTGEY